VPSKSAIRSSRRRWSVPAGDAPASRRFGKSAGVGERHYDQPETCERELEPDLFAELAEQRREVWADEEGRLALT